jgi:hypothetical protein
VDPETVPVEKEPLGALPLANFRKNRLELLHNHLRMAGWKANKAINLWESTSDSFHSRHSRISTL